MVKLTEKEVKLLLKLDGATGEIKEILHNCRHRLCRENPKSKGKEYKYHEACLLGEDGVRVYVCNPCEKHEWIFSHWKPL